MKYTPKYEICPQCSQSFKNRSVFKQNSCLSKFDIFIWQYDGLFLKQKEIENNDWKIKNLIKNKNVTTWKIRSNNFKNYNVTCRMIK